jgi:hypothetical protein
MAATPAKTPTIIAQRIAAASRDKAEMSAIAETCSITCGRWDASKNKDDSSYRDGSS